MKNDDRTTIKNLLLRNFAWIVGVLAFFLGLYIHNAITPVAHDIDVLAKDVEYNTKEIQQLLEIRDIVITNNSKIDGLTVVISDLASRVDSCYSR